MSTPEVKRLTPYVTPQARFQLSADNVRKHRDMVDGREFERGADFAMLEYVAQTCQRETNPTILGLKIAGAQEFLKSFKTLGETIEIKPPVRHNDNLPTE